MNINSKNSKGKADQTYDDKKQQNATEKLVEEIKRKAHEVQYKKII